MHRVKNFCACVPKTGYVFPRALPWPPEQKHLLAQLSGERTYCQGGEGMRGVRCCASPQGSKGHVQQEAYSVSEPNTFFALQGNMCGRFFTNLYDASNRCLVQCGGWHSYSIDAGPTTQVILRATPAPAFNSGRSTYVRSLCEIDEERGGEGIAREAEKSIELERRLAGLLLLFAAAFPPQSLSTQPASVSTSPHHRRKEVRRERWGFTTG